MPPYRPGPALLLLLAVVTAAIVAIARRRHLKRTDGSDEATQLVTVELEPRHPSEDVLANGTVVDSVEPRDDAHGAIADTDSQPTRASVPRPTSKKRRDTVFLTGSPYGRTCNRLITVVGAAQRAKRDGADLAIGGELDLEMSFLDHERLAKFVGGAIMWGCSWTEKKDAIACVDVVGERQRRNGTSLDEIIPVDHETVYREALNSRLVGDPVHLSRAIRRRSQAAVKTLRAKLSSPDKGAVLMVHRRQLEGECQLRVKPPDPSLGYRFCGSSALPSISVMQSDALVCSYRFDPHQLEAIFRSAPTIQTRLQTTPPESNAMILTSDGQDPEGDAAIKTLSGVDKRLHVGLTRDVKEILEAAGEPIPSVPDELFLTEVSTMIDVDVLFANHASSCSALVAKWRAYRDADATSLMFPTWCFHGSS